MVAGPGGVIVPRNPMAFTAIYIFCDSQRLVRSIRVSPAVLRKNGADVKIATPVAVIVGELFVARVNLKEWVRDLHEWIVAFLHLTSVVYAWQSRALTAVGEGDVCVGLRLVALSPRRLT